MTRAEALKVAKPILFNTEMVRAILWEIAPKTVTRRIVKLRDGGNPNWTGYIKDGLTLYNGNNEPCSKKPPYEVGDILYVRETWCKRRFIPPDDKAIPVGFKYFQYCYRADDEIVNSDGSKFKWKPSIHMPKEAARIFLRVTGMRVERLQDIITGDYRTPLNINREGLLKPCLNCTHHNGDCKDYIANNDCRLVDSYIILWDSTIKKSDLDKYGWNANPWVWVVEFEKLEIAEKNRP